MKESLFFIFHYFICNLIFGQSPDSIIFIKSDINSNKNLVFYKHNLKIDTLRSSLNFSGLKIIDYKFNIDSSICTILYFSDKLNYFTLRYSKKDNWMPISNIQNVCREARWEIKKDPLILSGSLPTLINFDKIQINEGTSYTNRKTHKRIKTIEKIYFLKFDENDNLIESTNDK